MNLQPLHTFTECSQRRQWLLACCGTANPRGWRIDLSAGSCPERSDVEGDQASFRSVTAGYGALASELLRVVVSPPPLAVGFAATLSVRHFGLSCSRQLADSESRTVPTAGRVNLKLTHYPIMRRGLSDLWRPSCRLRQLLDPVQYNLDLRRPRVGIGLHHDEVRAVG